MNDNADQVRRTDKIAENEIPADGKLYGIYDWDRERVAWVTLIVSRDAGTRTITVHDVGKHRLRQHALSWIEQQFRTRPWEKQR